MNVLIGGGEKGKVYQVAINILFWLMLALMISYVISLSDEMGQRSLSSIFLQGFLGLVLLLVPVAYFNTLVLVPRFLVKKQYWQYVLSAIIVAFVWPPLPIYIDNLIDVRFFGASPEELDQPFDKVAGFVMLLVIAISTLVKMTFRSFRQQGKVDKIENERLVMELSMLRNQISPHFFFNTLNNLYALALEQSRETPDVILKLSEMMRYTIYDCNSSQVPLKGEVKYLENYIALQQIRHIDKSTIQFKQEINNKEVEICPLILIVFLENAFKHGIDGAEQSSFINMHLYADDNVIKFSIENSIAEKRSLEPSGGLGLKNAKKRLELVYGEKYGLKMGAADDQFSVDLEIKLN